MKRFIWIVVLCVAGCFYQGVKGVYYVTMETELLDEDGDGVQDGVIVFLLFRDRDMNVVSFDNAECTTVIKVYNSEGLVSEKEVSFSSSAMVGEQGGGIPIVVEEGVYDIEVVIKIEGRGEFRTEKEVKVG
ncbi:MAG: hypothetical protein HXS46_09800 [Theionarchaea archaeon]|nr:hypothetical protein [Theionarchaea archaeon]